MSRSAFQAWATARPWGRRIPLPEASRLSDAFGIPVPASREVQNPSDGFSEWADSLACRIGEGRNSGTADAGLLMALSAEVFSRWAAEGLSPRMGASHGRLGTKVRISAPGASEWMVYSLEMEAAPGDLVGVLKRTAKEGQSAGTVGVSVVSGDYLLGLERQLCWLRNQSLRRMKDRAAQPAEILASFEKSMMDFCRDRRSDR